MDKQVIERIIKEQGINHFSSIAKIDIGFTNAVYSIDNQYILKVCKDSRNEKRFGREAFFYRYFEGRIPVPSLMVYDRSKDLCEFNYMMYHKIIGNKVRP